MTIPLPIEIDDVSLAFPADALDYMPAWEDIPEDFRNGHTPWNEFQRTWFFEGLSKRFSFVPATVDGETLNARNIYRQLVAIQSSYAPKHEHKEAAVAYLASIWMESMVYGRPKDEDSELIALGEGTLDDWLEHWREEEAEDEGDRG